MRLPALKSVVRSLRRRPGGDAPARPRARARARFAVALLLPTFLPVLCAAWAATEAVVPEVTDADYHLRLRVARAAQAEHPNRPLAVLIGSSRTMLAFAPEHLTDPDGPYWVNASHTGTGPTLGRLLLHRLLRDGVRPAALALEVMPPFFFKEGGRTTIADVAVAELPLVRRYADRPFDFDYHFLCHRVRRAPDLARAADPFAGRPEPLARGGYRDLEDEVAPAVRERRTAMVRGNYAAAVRTGSVRPAADRAFRDTLREAADRGIRVVLLRTPEGPEFRSWYDPAVLARFDAYLAGVAAEFGVPVVDARLWLEEEDFFDSHHALRRGADKFTARFAREIPAALAR